MLRNRIGDCRIIAVIRKRERCRISFAEIYVRRLSPCEFYEMAVPVDADYFRLRIPSMQSLCQSARSASDFLYSFLAFESKRRQIFFLKML